MGKPKCFFLADKLMLGMNCVMSTEGLRIAHFTTFGKMVMCDCSGVGS